MFECKYKFTLEDNIISAKYVFNSQKRKRDKVIAVLLPILIVVTLAMLILDIVRHTSLVWDIILLVALVVLQVMYLLIPLSIVSATKKSYKKQNLADMDYLIVTIDNTGICTETLIKDEQEVAKTAHSLRSLTSYIEDNERIVLVFNKTEYTCLKKDCFKGGIEKLKVHIEKAMQKSNKSKR